MVTELGTIQEGFRPSLVDCGIYMRRHFLEEWEIPDLAIPAPLPDGAYKAAVWIGRKAVISQESAILAVALPAGHEPDKYEDQWFVGLEDFEWQVGQYGKAGSELELAKLAIDRAIHGPTEYLDAMSMLESFVCIKN